MHSIDSFFDKEALIKTEYILMRQYHIPYDTETYFSTHNRTCLLLLHYGEVYLEARHKKFTFDKQHSLILAPFTKVSLTTLRNCHMTIYEFKNELIEHIADKLHIKHLNLQQNQRGNVVLLNTLTSNIQNELKELVIYGKAHSRADIFLVDLVVQKLIYNLLGYKNAGQVILSQIHNPIEHILKYIRSHPEERLQVKDLASELNMSESNFTHSFKHYTGITPIAYIHQIKMKEAGSLLERLSVTETAFELGFDTPSYFIKLFKKTYGLTPKQYQMKVL